MLRTYPLRKLENTLTDLHREREKSEKILYAIGDGVISTDHQGKVLFINRVGEALVGIGPAEVVGRQLEEVYVLRRTQESQAGEINDREVVLVGKGGYEYVVGHLCRRTCGFSLS